VAARTGGRDVAAGRESHGSSGKDATVLAFLLTGAANTAQAGPPRSDQRREGVWAEWKYDPVVNWGQVTNTMLGLALLEYGRAARHVGGPLAGSPTWHAASLNQAVRARMRKGGFPLVDSAYVDS